MLSILAGIAVTTFVLWLIIYFVTGQATERWAELFIWALFLTLLNVSHNFLLIFSNTAAMIITARLIIAVASALLLYVLLDMRLGIGSSRQKWTIAGIFCGGRLALGLVFG